MGSSPSIPPGGLSLWLVPAGDQAIAIKSLIRRLAQEGETERALFDPHLTLVSDDQVPEWDTVLERVSTAVQEWRQNDGAGGVSIIFDNLLFKSSYFQCVLIATQKEPALMALNARLRVALEVSKNAAPYDPHMSLVYGHLSTEEREACIDQLRATGDVKPSLQNNGTIEVAGLTHYEPREILLVETRGPTDRWKLLGSVSLDDGLAQEAS